MTHLLKAKAEKLAFAVTERLRAIDSAPPDAYVTGRLLAQSRELAAACNELHNLAIGKPQPPPAP